MTGHLVVDLFAGPGGFDLGARAVGVDPVGIEIDLDTCATRSAAGLATIRADLKTFPPDALHVAGPLGGVLGSPPCQAFSNAGDRTARADIDQLVALLTTGTITTGNRWVPAKEGAGLVTIDARLCVEPLRWVWWHQPEWVVLEQVPSVAPIWAAAGSWLRARGYHTWTGVLNAADYGVPQTRRRAFLIAAQTHQPARPHPTHDQPGQIDQGALFPLPAWVTMADALNLPTPGEVNTGQNSRLSNGTLERYTRSTERPAPTVTTVTTQTASWVLNQYDERTHPSGDGRPYRWARTLDEPAPTIMGKANRWEWALDPREHDNKLTPADRGPAQTVTGSSVNNWVFRRPATTVTADPRIWPPGHRLNSDDIERLGHHEAHARYSTRAGTTAIKVTPTDAAALQTFPPDHPWAGTKTSQARQIGNAVPPLLATAVIAQALNQPNPHTHAIPDSQVVEGGDQR